ncbi:basic-leucine zipper transcription factor family protein [Striga asiatica]|uniref:Basic-leucine zipper transcription factor family protein n=1 Tax=Striga asiatica TaxID=4170 RepID=A0A5A7QY66_STRAF|nr:basic-leucine zipper transcription factor family protein [Striga asiatica]
MDSSSGGASSEKAVDQRKRKRMISNRDSARRSRARKQKHLDDLVAQVAELREENRRILAGLNAAAQNFAGVESENAVLRAQMAELSHRLRSLEEILGFLSGGDLGVTFAAAPAPAYGISELAGFGGGGGFWNCSSQPIMMGAAPADPGFLY